MFIETVKKTTSPAIPGRGLNEPFVSSNTTGDIGLELEMEGRRLAAGTELSAIKSPSGSSWTIHNDGSLRNGGVEFVLGTPCLVDEVLPLTEGLFDYLRRQGSEIIHSNRTSTHVHININGMKVSELTSFICLWGLFEPLFVEYHGHQRKTNHFCLSSLETRWLPSSWEKALKTGHFVWDKGTKYCALNLSSFNTFGSFEFRQMAGAENADSVNKWARILWALREYSKGILPDELAYSTSERGPRAILEGIGDDYSCTIVENLLEQPDIDRRCLDNFRDYQSLAFCIDWSNRREEIDKKFLSNPFKTKKKTRGFDARIEDFARLNPIHAPPAPPVMWRRGPEIPATPVEGEPT